MLLLLLAWAEGASESLGGRQHVGPLRGHLIARWCRATCGGSEFTGAGPHGCPHTALAFRVSEAAWQEGARRVPGAGRLSQVAANEADL